MIAGTAGGLRCNIEPQLCEIEGINKGIGPRTGLSAPIASSSR
jgi:hypothetical protein